MRKNYKAVALAMLGTLFITGCAPEPESIDVGALRSTVSQDLAAIYREPKISGKMKLEEVLARALKHNLDTKVAELDALIAADDVSLEMLNSLPSVTAKVQRVGRSNEGGSSSFSLLTGQQSLEPSISSDQYRNVHQLSAEWNLLDAGINLWRARSASDRVMIAQERRRKVYHSVLQDAYSAYWRVAAAQYVLPSIDELLEESDLQLEVIEAQIEEGLVPLGDAQNARSKLFDKRQQLMNMRQSLALSEIELKTLINYPLDAPLKLDTQGDDWLSIHGLPALKGEIENFEETAFMNRPELREEILNKRISMRDIKFSLLETLPGAELIFTYNYDSNEFLSYNTWIDGVIGLTQTINRIITAPARYSRAKNVDLLADKRRQALLAAVITQVHVARARYDYLVGAYRENERAAKNARDIYRRAVNFKDAGLSSGAEYLNVKIDAKINEINRAFAYADAQDAYGRFITTLGIDLWDADDAGLSVPNFADQIKRNLEDENIFITASLAGEAQQ